MIEGGKKMDNGKFLKKGIIFGITILLISISFNPYTNVVSKNIDKEDLIPININEEENEKIVNFYIFDKNGKSEQEITMTSEEFENFYFTFKDLNNKLTYQPFSSETKVLKSDFADLLDSLDFIPEKSSKEDIIDLLNPSIEYKHRPLLSLIMNPVMQGRGYAFFCNYATFGEGSQLPVLIFPRLIPIILAPIPRVFMRWDAIYGVTSCGGLISGKGFIAEGAQQGFALGFWGIGFSVFLPPVMSYGFIGYAMFSTATAENIIPWPPNSPPVVQGENPSNGTENIPLNLDELSFNLSDVDGDRMSYSVTTDPDIGSGNGKGFDGIYSITISGLEKDSQYSWNVKVTDGENTVEQLFSFITVSDRPYVYEINPKDGAINVDINLSELTFSLGDYQGDKMDYTVETVPNIGIGNGNGVDNGSYSVEINQMDYFTNYKWFVNVTDGNHWTREYFTYTTRPEGVVIFNPTDDSIIKENVPDGTYGSSNYISIRNYGGEDWTYQGLIKFDLSSIPTDAEIVSAKLYCYYLKYKDSNPSGDTFNLYRITSNWDEETVTWNTQPSCESQPTSFVNIPSSPGIWLEWDVKSDIENFTNGNWDNFGWKIYDVTYWSGANIPLTRLCSKEYESNIPYLEIMYS
jgi:hypothetical protein